jgi:phosphopantetheinyl transferase
MSRLATPWPHACLVLTEWSSAVFTEEELRFAAGLKLEKRRNEWLLSRAAAKQLAVELQIASNPWAVTVERPDLLIDGRRSGWHVSLSHSGVYAAAAIGPGPIGIDVQTIRDLSESAAHLFMTDDEAEVMRRCAVPHRLLHFWSAKEAAWKQSSGDVETLKQLPLTLLREKADGLVFRQVESALCGDVIVALTATS